MPLVAAAASVAAACTLSLAVAVTPAASAPSAAGVPKLSAVLTAFLAESAAAPSRAVPWKSLDSLPLKWEGKGPVATTDTGMKSRGITQTRMGTARVLLDGGAPKEIQLIASGNAAGIQSVNIGIAYGGNGEEAEPMDRIGRGLAADGLKLGFLKCRREGEGVVGGNVVYLLEAPGRKPAALVEYWSCAGDGSCGLDLTLLDPKSDFSDYECHG